MSHQLLIEPDKERLDLAQNHQTKARCDFLRLILKKKLFSLLYLMYIQPYFFFDIQDPKSSILTRQMEARQKLKKLKEPIGQYFMDENLDGLSDIEVPQIDDGMEFFEIDNIGFSTADEEDLIPDLSDDEIRDIVSQLSASEHVSINSN